jgi:hypothetical protein
MRAPSGTVPNESLPLDRACLPRARESRMPLSERDRGAFVVAGATGSPQAADMCRTSAEERSGLVGYSTDKLRMLAAEVFSEDLHTTLQAPRPTSAMLHEVPELGQHRFPFRSTRLAAVSLVEPVEE